MNLSSLVRGTAVLAISCCFAVDASAWRGDRTLHTRTQQLHIDVLVDKSQKRITPKKSGSKSKRPKLTADDMIRIGGTVSKLDQKQIKTLEAMISVSSRTATDLPDLYFRLAEKHAKLTRYFRIRAIDLDMKIHVQKKPRARIRLKRLRARFFKASTKHLIGAVKAYQATSKYKNYRRADQALFYLAFTLRQAKYPRRAREVLQQLIKEHPSSKFMPHAYLSFGDYFFEKRAFANAEKFYAKVLRFRRSPVYAFALFKTGWVYLNMKKDQKALESFYKVTQVTKGKYKKRSLFRAAKNSFVRSYAAIGRPRRALRAFKRVDRASAFGMLEALAQHYIADGKAHKAVFTFRELIRLAPKHQRVCDWQYSVVQAMLGVGTPDQKRGAVTDLAKLYSAYRARRILRKDALAECADNAMGLTNEMARLWHKEARTTKDPRTFVRSAQLYRVYVRHFPKGKDRAANQYWLAELLWQRAVEETDPRRAVARWHDASAAFTQVVRARAVSKGRIKTSALAAVLALENANRVDPRPRGSGKAAASGKADARGVAVKPLSAKTKNMLAALDAYLRYVKQPKDKTRVRVQFLKAQIFWRHNRFKRAVPLLEGIVGRHLKHDSARFSVNILLDIFVRTGRHHRLLQWVDQLLAPRHRAFLAKHADLADNLRKMKRLSLRKRAKGLEARGKFIACGDAYRAVFNSKPNADDAHELLWNAGTCYEKGKSLGVAIRAFKRLRANFPKTLPAKRAIAKLGFIYSKIAWYDAAAARYVEYANRFGGQRAGNGLKSADDALSTAVFYFRGIGDDRQAIRNTLAFVRRYGKTAPRRAAEAYYSLHSIYDKQRNSDNQARHWRRYLQRHARHGGIDRQLIANVKLAMLYWKSSCKVRGVLGACVRVVVYRRRRGPKTQCGPDEARDEYVIPRNKALVRNARRHLAAAVRLWKNGAVTKVPAEGKQKAARTALLIKHYAAARFLLNETSYARFLSLGIPNGLSFDPRNPRVAARSKKRFERWLIDKQRLLATTAAAYHRVRAIRGGGAHYAIASAARIGQMFQHLSSSLFRAPVPRQLRRGANASERIHAYCSELSRVSIPLQVKSVRAYSFCLNVSTKRGWFSQWSRACEKRLGVIRPAQFPSKPELFAPANRSAPVLTLEAPTLKLPAR